MEKCHKKIISLKRENVIQKLITHCYKNAITKYSTTIISNEHGNIYGTSRTTLPYY
mgnify:CR=1 FL=1